MSRSPFAKLRGKRRELPIVELSLAAMVDMMINILIFLLHLYGKDSLEAPVSADLELARSQSQDPIHARIGVVVSRRGIAVGGDSVLGLVEVDGAPGLPDGVSGTIPGLAERLDAELKRLPAPAEGEAFVPELLVQTDRRVPWSVLGAVIRSAAQAGIGEYRFVVATETR